MSDITPELLVDGLCFAEGPRWHDGALWFSDMHAHKVLKMTPDGSTETIVEVPACPSGLGWLPDGDLLIVSMEDRRLLRFDGTRTSTHADLSALAPYHCNDMVVDESGRAYVGNFGFNLHVGEAPTSTCLICVEPDGAARIVAEKLQFPNGAVITPDGNTLIVAESFGGRLSAFTIEANGDLSQHREWAALPDRAVPDGICLDAAGGIWAASPSTNECLRIVEGGDVTHRVALDRSGIACMLGESTLYILSSKSTAPAKCQAEMAAQILTITAPYPHAGQP